MKCIYCGENINEDITKCPKCGKLTQMVPDYSIYDDDNINVLLEGTPTVPTIKKTNTESDTDNQDIPKKKTEEKEIKQRLIILVCIIFLTVGLGAKLLIDNSNQNSLEYQLKKGNEALRTHNYEEARSFFEQANRLAPQNSEVLFALSQVYSELGYEKESYLPVFSYGFYFCK